MKKIIYKIAIILAVSVLSFSCEKEFLDTYPTDGVSSSAVTQTTDNAWAALNGIHRALYVRYEGTQGNGGLGSHYIVVDCMAEDHVVNREQWYNQVYKWNAHRNATYYYNRFPWRMFYQWISNANTLINGVDGAVGTDDDKNNIKGQALIYRAFSHYEIVQLYAERYVPGGGNTQPGIPYMKENTPIGQPRVSVEQVYTDINADLDAAITLLAGLPRDNKSHMNVDVARGLKARVALTQGNYTGAAQWARDTRNMAEGSYSLMDSTSYYNGFRVNSESEGEYIWASQIIDAEQNDKWAAYGAYISRNFSSSAIRGNPRSINSELYNLLSPTDVRTMNYSVDGEHANLPSDVNILSSHSRHPYTNQKFLAVSNSDSRVDVPHLRLSELYLIEAEAEARLGNDAPAAAALLPMAQARDAQYVLSANTGQALIDEIMVQRRIELWGEGFRWYDLKRLNEDLVRAGNHDPALADNVMFVAAGGVDWVWLIPQNELDANEAIQQNPLN